MGPKNRAMNWHYIRFGTIPGMHYILLISRLLAARSADQSVGRGRESPRSGNLIVHLGLSPEVSVILNVNVLFCSFSSLARVRERVRRTMRLPNAKSVPRCYFLAQTALRQPIPLSLKDEAQISEPRGSI